MGDEIATGNGRLLSKDIQHLDQSLKEIKEALHFLDSRIERHLETCNDCRQKTAVEIATLKEQVKHGDQNTSALATIISAAFSTIAGVVSALVGGKP